MIYVYAYDSSELPNLSNNVALKTLSIGLPNGGGENIHVNVLALLAGLHPSTKLTTVTLRIFLLGESEIENINLGAIRSFFAGPIPAVGFWDSVVLRFAISGRANLNIGEEILRRHFPELASQDRLRCIKDV